MEGDKAQQIKFIVDKYYDETLNFLRNQIPRIIGYNLIEKSTETIFEQLTIDSKELSQYLVVDKTKEREKARLNKQLETLERCKRLISSTDYIWIKSHKPK